MSPPQTIPALFFLQADRLRDRPLFWTKQAGRYQAISWSEAQASVEALSGFLLSLQLSSGDRVLLLSENRAEWGIADLAVQACGAWTVPVYPSLTEHEVLQIAADAEPVVCIASTSEQAKKLRAIRQQLGTVRQTIVIDPVATQAEYERSWSQVMSEGKSAIARCREVLVHRWHALNPDDIATLIYTSGTTGEPKGVMLSHRNFLSNAEACLRVISVSESDLHLSFLPLSHVFERMAGWYLIMLAGGSVAYAENMETISQNMLEIHPTLMLGVPRFFEKLYTKIQDGIAHAPWLKRLVARWALQVGQQATGYRLRRLPLPMLLRLQQTIAAHLVFKTLQQRLGGRLKFFVSGSAPLSKTIGEFFYSMGVVILEGYGLTETSPVIAVNHLAALKFGTVGPLLDGVEVRIADDGEILTRGPNVMYGYYRKPEETAAVMTGGWFHTGDIGSLDDEGFLSVTDRKKDLIKTSGGKFVAPQKIENLLIMDPYILQAFVYGDRERYCVALVVPNLPRLSVYASSQGIPFTSQKELVQLPQIRDFMWQRVQALQEGLASFEQIKAIALLDQEFTQAAGELTPTLKVKRAVVAKRHEAVLRQLYEQPLPASHPRARQ